MALSFPNSPTEGQIYTDTPSGNRWVWDSANTIWKSTSTFTQTITVSSTAPGTPVVGQLWWNQDYGRLLVYYSDGTSSQWVDASPSDYTSGLAYASANSNWTVTNTVYTIANAAYGLSNTALQNTNVTLAGNLTVTGNVIANKQVTVTYTPATSVNATITLAAANTQGGTGYADFLKATNLSGGTNPNKTFRLNSTGSIEVINSAYTANLLTIDDSGRVTTPSQPAFMAYNTTTYSGTGNVPWNATILNRGSNYNTSTYTFTAPVAGLYWFNVIITNGSTSQTLGLVALNVNGGRVRDFFESNPMSASNAELHSSIIYYLQANDTATVYSSGAGTIEGGAAGHQFYSMFQGYLIG